MGIDHGGGNIVVPEQLLNGADVGAALQQVGGEGMPKGMGADVLRQTGTADGHLDGFVDDTGVNVMATGDTGARVDGNVPGREDRVQLKLMAASKLSGLLEFLLGPVIVPRPIGPVNA